MNRTHLALLALTVLTIAPTATHADVPRLIAIHGVISEVDGAPLSGDVDLTLSLYDGAFATTPLWVEQRTGDDQVTLTKGYFSLYLGEITPLNPALVASAAELWLALTVGDDDEMTRIQFPAVPYAFVASDVRGDIHPRSITVAGNPVIDSTGKWVGETSGVEGPRGPGGDPGESVTVTELPVGDTICPQGGARFQVGQTVAYACDGEPGPQGLPGETGPQGPAGPDNITSINAGDGLTGGGSTSTVAIGLADLGVTTAKLANTSVTDAKLALNAVTTTKVADLAVTDAKLALNAVTTTKVADLAITDAKLALNAVTTTKVADLAITTAKLADLAITTAKIADLAVTTAKIADLAVTDGELATNAVTTAKLDNLAVTEDKLALNAVTTTKVADLAITTAKLADLAVTTDKIADGAVTLAKIKLPSATITGTTGNGEATWFPTQSVSLTTDDSCYVSVTATSTWNGGFSVRPVMRSGTNTVALNSYGHSSSVSGVVSNSSYFGRSASATAVLTPTVAGNWQIGCEIPGNDSQADCTVSWLCQ